MAAAGRRIILVLALVAAATAGCTHLEPLSKTTLTAPIVVKDGVVLDVLFVHFPLGDREVNESVWEEVDELQIAPESRRRLEANGFRAGVLSGPLPLKLEQLLKLSESAPQNDAATPIVVDARPTARQRQLHVRGGRRTKILVMGERERRKELSLLLRDDQNRVEGRSFHDVVGLFSARAFPLGDGGVRLEMTPELEHGEAGKRFVPGDGMFRIEYGAPREVLDALQYSTSLGPGQILAVSTFPQRPGTVGYHFFTDTHDAETTQKMLLVRLSHCEHDDRFSDGPVASSGDGGNEPRAAQ